MIGRAKQIAENTQKIEDLRAEVQQHLETVRPIADEAAQKAQTVSTSLQRVGRAARRVRSNPCFTVVVDASKKT